MPDFGMPFHKEALLAAIAAGLSAEWLHCFCFLDFLAA